MKERFKILTFNAEKTRLIEESNKIIVAYKRQGYLLTLRQLYYQMIARDLFPDTWIDEEYNVKNGLAPDTKNTIKNYKRLGDLLNDARLGGMVDWDAIEDRTRNLESVNHWRSPSKIIEAVAAQYRIDKWKDQPRRIEVWVEKDALLGVLEKACKTLDVAWFSCRGYTSQSELYVAGKRLAEYKRAGQEPLIVHLGDHDPSGIDMSRDIEDRVSMLARTPIEVQRIALNMNQVEQYDPPPNPAKATDARYAGYRALYGEESWELDALDLAVLDSLITETVEGYRDQEKWDAAVEEEDHQRDLLAKASDNWDEVAEILEERF
jgi:hypothetical protein